jgi:hypothetical protein
MNSYVYALAVSGGDLYAGGYFTNAGGVAAKYVAKWDGNAWSALGSGMNSYVQALAVSGTNLYAGGAFTTAGGVSANRIAKWNGSTWSGLGSGMNDYVRALAVSGNDLYAGGAFVKSGDSASYYYHIAKWNGSAWSGLGSGMDGYVHALAVSGAGLYAGGEFKTAGTVVANRIARWNGSAWTALGSGVNSDVWALEVLNSDLYAGGSFTMATNGNGVATTANRIAQWNGTNWSALGSGTDDVVWTLAVSGNEIYAGGNFTTAGGKLSAYAAKAIIGVPSLSIVITNGCMVASNGQFHFTLTGPAGSNAVILASTNLLAWTPLATNPLAGGSLHFTDMLATNLPRRFYRALLQP